MNKRGGMNEATEEIIDRSIYTIADHSCWDDENHQKRDEGTIIHHHHSSHKLLSLKSPLCLQYQSTHNEHDHHYDRNMQGGDADTAAAVPSFLTTETIEGLSLSLESINDIHGSDSLSTSMLSVSHSITNDMF